MLDCDSSQVPRTDTSTVRGEHTYPYADDSVGTSYIEKHTTRITDTAIYEYMYCISS